jgi:3-(3-hydroxy-phenyl)propionate hydroxylase
VFGGDDAPRTIAAGDIEARVLRVGHDLVDAEGLLAARYDARPGTAYLIRPDHHVAARWRALDRTKVAAALRRATAQ